MCFKDFRLIFANPSRLDQQKSTLVHRFYSVSADLINSVEIASSQNQRLRRIWTPMVMISNVFRTFLKAIDNRSTNGQLVMTHDQQAINK